MAASTKLSIIVPSFNQASFLGECLESVVSQDFQNKEILVVDGGSTDGSLEIIQSYAPHLVYWRSHPDEGQSAAINEGMQRATGDYAGWVNSDDLLEPGALSRTAELMDGSDNTIYVGKCTTFGGQRTRIHQTRIQNLDDLLNLEEMWCAGHHIVQPETLFPRRLFLAVDGLNTTNHLSMDYELWGRLLLAGARIELTGVPYARFRFHPDQKTHRYDEMLESLFAASRQLAAEALHGEAKELWFEDADRREQRIWRKSGFLARMGLPKTCVRRLRTLRGY